MKQIIATLETDGSGLWSDTSKNVDITDIDIRPITPNFGELRVYFDLASWNPYEDGLIYTDDKFLKGLKELLAEVDTNLMDICYSEQGMQGDDYVSLDYFEKFAEAFKKHYPEEYAHSANLYGVDE